ncbi:MAG: precorrin-2 C(20)-methyltransferase [Nitrospinae bacterium]|nr:precorrin-2 C(20)-methyltransferase [Nitrospinota bacterium]
MEKNNIGTFYGLGVGPGDPKLITLKALEIIQAVDIVFIPVKKEGSESYAFNIVKEYVRPETQEIIELVFPMVKDKETLLSSWDKASETVFTLINEGKSAAFITEGDPFFYSTFIYLFERLKNKVPQEKIEVVPGITAFNASASTSGFSVANANDRLIVLPSTYGVEKLGEYLLEFETIILMKVNSVMEQVIEKIREYNLEKSFVFVERCGRPEERIITTINELKETKINYLSLIIIHSKKHNNR